MIIFFMIWPILEARAEVQKYFGSFFGSNEDIQKSFWHYLTFSPCCPSLKRANIMNDTHLEDNPSQWGQISYLWICNLTRYFLFFHRLFLKMTLASLWNVWIISGCWNLLEVFFLFVCFLAFHKLSCWL